MSIDCLAAQFLKISEFMNIVLISVQRSSYNSG